MTWNIGRGIGGNIREGIKITEIGLWKTRMNHLAGQSESEIRMETMISPSRAVIYVFTEVGKREMEEEEEEGGVGRGGWRYERVRARLS